MSLEESLGNQYRITARLPSLTATHQRYVVQGTSGTQEQFVLSYCDYVQPLSFEALRKQKAAAEAMARPPVALLCRTVEWSLEADSQWVVSELPQGPSLREVLQHRQSLGMEEVEAFLRLLTEACEAAVALGWPRLSMEAANLFHDTRLGLPRIPAPDIPLFENAGTDTLEVDPMATMQFNAVDLRSGVDPLPRDTKDYVLPLAALCVDLLGQPQAMRGGNARYQPVPQLTSQQNVLLRRALTSEGRVGFASAKSFIDEFFGVSIHTSMVAHTERLRSLTATMSSQSAAAAAPPPLSAALVTVRQPTPPPLPGAQAGKPQPVLLTKPMTVRAGDREAAEHFSPILRLRLMPDSEDSPVFALVADERLILGRSATDADFIAQFRPRSNTNDGRSRRISRAQMQLSLKGAKIALEESSAVNPSIIHDAPIPGYAEMSLPASFLLGGEYPVEVRPMPSDYDQPREVDLPHKDEAKLQGALIIRAGGPGVLMCEAAVVFSDVGLHFSKSGRPWLRAESSTMPAARFHRMAGQFWLEPIEASVISAPNAEGDPTKAHELVLLCGGTKLRIGSCGYTVQDYTLGGTGGGAGAADG
jgi:hypothetical protein